MHITGPEVYLYLYFLYLYFYMYLITSRGNGPEAFLDAFASLGFSNSQGFFSTEVAPSLENYNFPCQVEMLRKYVAESHLYANSSAAKK